PKLRAVKRLLLENWLTNNGKAWKLMAESLSDDDWNRLWTSNGYYIIPPASLRAVLQQNRRQWLGKTELTVIQKEFPYIVLPCFSHRGSLSWTSGVEISSSTTEEECHVLRRTFGYELVQYEV